MSYESRSVIDFTALHIRSSFIMVASMILLLTTITTGLIHLTIYRCFIHE